MTQITIKNQRELTDADKHAIAMAHEAAAAALKSIENLGVSYQLTLAKAKVEEALMWVTAHITAGEA